MERECMILTVDATHEGEVHTASYFVESGIIHANIGGRSVLAPLGNVPAADTVKALVIGYLLQKSRKMDNARKWVDRGNGGSANP